jgi:hypothetical protein
MNSTAIARFGSLLLASSVAVVGCSGDDDDGAPAAGGSAAHGGGSQAQGGAMTPAEAGAATASPELQCQVLGTLCHEADEGGGASHDCHELGHEGDGHGCVTGFAGCIETCVEGSEGREPLCAALGELCHAVDDEDGGLHECHELGHVNDRAVCAAQFDSCATACLAARKALEEGRGGAGAGGAAGDEPGRGGAGVGGHHD